MSDVDKTISDDALEACFEQARVTQAPLPEAAMARILADAAAVQPRAPRMAWRAWVRALGGAPGIGGLITATCVGFWIGIAPPQMLPDVGGIVLGAEVSAFDLDADGFGWDLEEG
ncbi:hypothetical protein [Sulfitobacter aestuariivivens]|uniref:Dihydroorotate dehydrogenase n=1 Tax=Sulfitobacter aestuariivivens TaxID=2766981 RepID=A0A927HD69_9RHOB|nr:hypothetical protein [Sulfitobacter aestuariivivens]MBD3662501.1 hypothetical protein [Sulfitobacter aestuariivivens]